MLKKLLSYLENKRILILGYGMEGEATYRFLRNHFPEKQLFIADRNSSLLDTKVELMEDMDLELSLGENYLNGIEEYDLIIKAPGISLKDVDISKYENKITSELELFLEFVDIFSIGITGTKGKSTTSTLMYKVLIDQEKDAYLLGNIGEPIFNSLDSFTKDSIAVIELSSHALEFVKHSCNIGFILDVFEEHLDHYKSLEKYIEAKFNLAKYMNEKDFLIYNLDNELMNKYGFKYKENDYAISLEKVPNTLNKVYIENDTIVVNSKNGMNINEEINLKGMHNINNIMFIYAASNILNLDFDRVLESIKEFKPLEHRMEFVAKINGVDYYNDSIATIPASTMNAVNALKNVNTLIVGGKDRGVNLEELIKFISNNEQIENVICLPKTGEFIKAGLEGTLKNVTFVEKLDEAVKHAKKVTKEGTICLLSPAASSYGYFKNFEERGRLFKKYVLENNE
ncbi:MAG: UDP-N-acetylmuramoyl-L-alanine--D-glutamate ligase [Clostridia bacterium]|nr:UDP-N-acetylmuramoyl-L-alanine--D-glutamate ligase [Clostridia bacterium]